MQDQFVPSYVHEIFRPLLDLAHVSHVHSPLRGVCHTKVLLDKGIIDKGIIHTKVLLDKGIFRN